MSIARPAVSVYNPENPAEKPGTVAMPTVMLSPIRSDLVQFVHCQISRNSRIAYGVAPNAGYQTSAESWGTGRAVARIPRVPGGGTHRAGQAAFGNMCRGGGMFAPTKVWRRWHRKVNLTQRRHAVASAIAASGVTGLVMARGHRVEDVLELPLVVKDSIQKVAKTKNAVLMLKKLGCQEELEKVLDSKKIRTGRGKARNRRYVMRKGPLIVYNEDEGLVKGFNNIPGVDVCHVDHLNLLRLAPGGHVGRFTVWSESAFKRLQKIYGTYRAGSKMKTDYVLPREVMSNPDLARIINSNEVQSVVKPAIKSSTFRLGTPRNPLKNYPVMCRLNPAYKTLKKRREGAINKADK